MICPNCGYCPHCGRGGHHCRPWRPQLPWEYRPPYYAGTPAPWERSSITCTVGGAISRAQQVVAA